MTTLHRPTLGTLALLFLKLGTVAFGGPAAHISMMQDEVVRRRRWLTQENFLDLVGATNLIPGPNSTELAIHIGRAGGGWPGLLIAGLCFILPSALIVTGAAWVYVAYGTLPQAEGLLYGIKPPITVIVLQAVLSLTGTAVKNVRLAVLGMTATLLAFLGVHELVVLFGSAAVYLVLCLAGRLKVNQQKLRTGVLFPALLLAGASPPVSSTAVGLWPLFGVFVKAGALLFGSGYVLLAFLRADLVERWRWLSEAQLVDAIAVGQITPGPVFTTATFVGYILAGPRGALVATIGIFLPAFLFVAITGPFVAKLRESAIAGHFLDAVNIASLALVAVVAWDLGRSAIVDATTLVIAIISAIALFRFHVNATWLIVAGAIVGLVGSFL